MSELEQARVILTAEVEARLALREAKARAFLDYVTVRGANTTTAWQQVALDPDVMELQRAYEFANIERLLLWLAHGVVEPGGPGDD
jgi:hypothetical protein